MRFSSTSWPPWATRNFTRSTFKSAVCRVTNKSAPRNPWPWLVVQASGISLSRGARFDPDRLISVDRGIEPGFDAIERSPVRRQKARAFLSRIRAVSRSGLIIHTHRPNPSSRLNCKDAFSRSVVQRRSRGGATQRSAAAWPDRSANRLFRRRARVPVPSGRHT